MVFTIGVLCNLGANAQTLSGTFISKFDFYYHGYTCTEENTFFKKEVAWKGERIYFQLLLWSGKDISDLDIIIGDFVSDTSSFTPGEASLRFGRPVKGDVEPRSCLGYRIRDSYIPISDAYSKGPVTKLNANDTISILVALDIPKDLTQGDYKGKLSVHSGDEMLEFNIEIEILDMILPETGDWSFHLDLWQFPATVLSHYNNVPSNIKIGLWSDAHFDLVMPAYQILAHAGQKVITAHIKEDALGSPSMIKWIFGEDGSWSYDYTAFDKYISRMMSLGIDKQINCFSPIGWNENEIPYWDEQSGNMKLLKAELGSTEYRERWDHFLAGFKAHLLEKGWFDITVLYLDEVSEQKLQYVMNTVLKNDPDWKIGIAYLHDLDQTVLSRLYDVSGILEYASNSGVTENMVSTFYTSCTQIRPNSYVTPLSSPAEMTWMAYYCASKGFDGYLRWAYDFWRNENPFDIRDGSHTAGDFALIYRDGNISPIEYYSSLRLEMLREGIEDFEKISALRKLYNHSGDPENMAITHLLKNYTLENIEDIKSLIERSQQQLNRISKGDFNDGIN